MSNILSEDYIHESPSRRRFLAGTTSFIIAALLSVSTSREHAFQSSGTNLGEVHNDNYEKLISGIEPVLQNNRVKVTGFYGRILRERETKEYILEYVLTTETLIGDELPHRHIELVSTVWREQNVGKENAKKEQQQKLSNFFSGYKVSYPENGKPYFIHHESGDKDLYQVGDVVVW